MTEAVTEKLDESAVDSFDGTPDQAKNPGAAALDPDSQRHTPEQQELPFAIVQGKTVTEMPKDLYVPPAALEVFLEAFEGPLDFLLYLIRRQNIDILDINVSKITSQYIIASFRRSGR
jgi:segregation and condensation protein A